MKIEWEDSFKIHVKVDGDTAIVSANREGLLSLAKQLKDLAEETPGTHVHYDEYSSLEEGSSELIIEKTE